MEAQQPVIQNAKIDIRSKEHGDFHSLEIKFKLNFHNSYTLTHTHTQTHTRIQTVLNIWLMVADGMMKVIEINQNSNCFWPFSSMRDLSVESTQKFQASG